MTISILQDDNNNEMKKKKKKKKIGTYYEDTPFCCWSFMSLFSKMVEFKFNVKTVLSLKFVVETCGS